MKILFYGINFSPELTGIGKYTGEMAEWFALQGHDVRVITAPPYYPDWKINPEFKNGYHKQSWEGVTVYRCPLWVPKKLSGLKRLIHLASFALSSIPVLFAQWRWKPDVVWVVEPPLMCAPAAAIFAKSCGAKSWLHIQDYEVDAAFEMGLIKGRRLRYLVESLERILMRCFNRVSSISGRMLDLTILKGISADKVVSFPNWVDMSSIRPLTAPSIYRAKLNISSDKIVALYSGNMGGKQGLEILASVANILSKSELAEKVQFVFCGNGAGRADLEHQCRDLNNVKFLDLQPLEDLSDLLGLADIHLLPQRADAADLVMPSKLTGMLASGRAVLATTNLDTELGRVIQNDAKCGVITPPENAEAMADSIIQLATNPQLRDQFGKNGRVYAVQKLDKANILKNYESDLMDLIANN